MNEADLDDVIRYAVTEVGDPWFAVELALTFAMRASRHVATDDEGAVVGRLIAETANLRYRSTDELFAIISAVSSNKSPVVSAFKCGVAAAIETVGGGSARRAVMHAQHAADFACDAACDAAMQYERRAIALQVSESVRYRKENP